MFMNSFLLQFLLEGQCPEATASMNRAGHPEETMTYSTRACDQISCEVTWWFHIGYCWEEIFRDSVGLQYYRKGDTLKIKISTFIFKILLFIYFIFILLNNTVLVLPYIDMNPPRVFMSSQSWTPPPTSLPISSLWVIPVHQPQASCILYRT